MRGRGRVRRPRMPDEGTKHSPVHGDSAHSGASLLTYQWSLLDKPAGSRLCSSDLALQKTALTEFIPDAPGRFLLELKIRCRGHVYSETTTVYVLDSSDPGTKVPWEEQDTANVFVIRMDFGSRARFQADFVGSSVRPSASSSGGVPLGASHEAGDFPGGPVHSNR